jgi:hypothetical protein
VLFWKDWHLLNVVINLTVNYRLACDTAASPQTERTR